MKTEFFFLSLSLSLFNVDRAVTPKGERVKRPFPLLLSPPGEIPIKRVKYLSGAFPSSRGRFLPEIVLATTSRGAAEREAKKKKTRFLSSSSSLSRLSVLPPSLPRSQLRIKH